MATNTPGGFEQFDPPRKQVTKVPILGTINGCGFDMYGRRDNDPKSGTYIKTHCFCFLFIPIVALSAYRVADAPSGGWYFIYKERLSKFAKFWNLALFASIFVGAGYDYWNGYFNSPNYRAGVAISKAAELNKAGQPLEAVKKYSEVAFGPTSRNHEAADAAAGVIDASILTASAADAAEFLRYDLSIASTALSGPERMKKPLAHGDALIEKFRGSDPRAALKALDTMGGYTDIKPRRLALLEEAVAKNTGDAVLASELAVIYEQEQKLEQCLKILEPAAKSLGTTEGARILGQIYARDGKMDESFALLNPYILARLERYRAAEKSMKQQYENAHNMALAGLRQGAAGKDWYGRYEQAPKVEQEKLVDEYIQAAMKSNVNLNSEIEQYKKESNIVPAVMDLGIVRLRRAQGMGEPAARKTELREAETLFLAIREAAGGNDDYKLFYGQVCYWLGKHDEGKKEFDALITANNRSSKILNVVGQTLRQVGEVPQARAVLEEAYNKETDVNERYQLAVTRSVLHLDVDDRIKWLLLGNPASEQIKADLASARGAKAYESGDFTAAAKGFHTAATYYDSLPKSATALNNAAIEYSAAFDANGDSAEFMKALSKMEEAMQLSPDNTVELDNVMEMHTSAAALELLGGTLDLKILRERPTLLLLRSLYENLTERALIEEKLKLNGNFIKTRSEAERLMLLSPKRSSGYVTAFTLAMWLDDAATVRAIRDRLKQITFDHSDAEKQRKEYASGVHDAKYAEQSMKSMTRHEAIAAAANTPPATAAVAAAEAVTAGISAAMYGQPADPDKLVALAEKAIKLRPSVLSRSSLSAALKHRALRTLEKSAQAWGALGKESRRMLDDDGRITVALEAGAELAAPLLENADFKRYCAMELEDRVRFPDYADLEAWHIFNKVNPDAAQKLAAVIREKTIYRDRAEVNWILTNGGSATVALESFLFARFDGDNAKARKAIDDAEKNGAEIPPTLKKIAQSLK